MNDQYLTVTALTKYIKRKMDTDPHLKDIWLKGEISNFKHHSRGHMYLTIKDKESKIKSVMFKGNNRFLKFTPEDGMKVLIRGEVGVYEAFGQYQLYIKMMEPDGLGSLYLAFEQLKKKLEKQGYFEARYKQDIPSYPNHIGVITSPTGAAVRDIIITLNRRYPMADVTVLPVLVQGENGAASIARAIRTANEQAFYDTLIIGRGGGSIEELWNFHEEIVAHAIFESNIPIISAVGHETDITISDYVADLRAPTPTGAAELAVPSQLELKDRLSRLRHLLAKDMNQLVTEHSQHLQRLQKSYAFRYPEQLVKQKEQQLDDDVDNLQKLMKNLRTEQQTTFSHLYKRLKMQHPEKQIEQYQENLTRVYKRHHDSMTQILEKKSMQLANTIEKMSLLNPLEIMKRGFALPYHQDGSMIKSVNHVKQKESITLKMNDGSLYLEVIDKEEKNHERK